MNFLKKIMNKRKGQSGIERLEAETRKYVDVAKQIRRNEERIMLDPKSHGLGKKGANPYER
ncbi:hypothetical protein [Paenibacillus kandeliae]|uniref:hypothetical protein n=1 Tax=Paenibacillus kandeliae TaxID=3231269 RepID=UPI003458A308